MVKQNFQLTRPCVLYCVILFTISQSSAITLEEMTVEAGDLGTIVGMAQNSTALPDSVEHIRFVGIPYATHSRFLPSDLRIGPLNGSDPFSAHTYGAHCPQQGGSFQSEDCLFLNIWTRRVNKAGAEPVLRPVIVFVHGGGFTIGNGQFFPGEMLINRDVVYVNFHYRLGVLGFFCLNNEEAPGNAGMYDVVTALKWVKEYIHHFGGDPNKVTLAGQSAGGVAVSLMMVSPLAQGLFHNAIVASGSILNQWGYTNDSRTPSLAIAERLDCYDGVLDNLNTTAVVECMKAVVNTTNLVKALFDHQATEMFQGRLGLDAAAPTIQYFNLPTTIPKLFEEDPNKIFEDGRQSNIPLMIGTTLHDGSYVMGVNYKSYLAPNNLTDNTDFMKNDIVPMILQSLGVEDGSYGIYEALAQLYIGDVRFTGDLNLMLPGLIDLHNVFFYKAAAYRTAQLHSKLNSNTFLYSFDYQGPTSYWRFLFSFSPPPFPGGVCHTDDLLYLFPRIAEFSDMERNVSNQMINYWTNLAEFGNPTTPTGDVFPIWPNLTNENQFLNIDVVSRVNKNYQDTWANVSIELFPHLIPTEPPTEAPTTTASPTTTEVPTTTAPPTTTAGVERVSLLSLSLSLIFIAISLII